MIRYALVTGAIVALALGSAGCSDYRLSKTDAPAETRHETVVVERPNNALMEDAAATLSLMQQKDAGVARFVQSCYGYAVFPRVNKGAIGIGGAYGSGVLYEHGVAIGTVTLTQGTLGAQLGGEVFSEIVFFKDKATIDHFKLGNTEFAAQASAVAAASGASASADWDNGVAVFTMTRTGLMFEAAIGGQKFSYRPLAI